MCLKNSLEKVVKKKGMPVFNIVLHSVLYFNLFINIHLEAKPSLNFSDDEPTPLTTLGLHQWIEFAKILKKYWMQTRRISSLVLVIMWWSGQGLSKHYNSSLNGWKFLHNVSSALLRIFCPQEWIRSTNTCYRGWWKQVASNHYLAQWSNDVKVLQKFIKDSPKSKGGISVDHPKLGGFESSLRKLRSGLNEVVKSVANVPLPITVQRKMQDETLRW